MPIPNDSRDIEENCLLCGAWTKSHVVPGGWVCHTCLTDDGEKAVEQAVSAMLGAEVRRDGLDARECLRCPYCHGFTTLSESSEEEGHVYLSNDVLPFEDAPHLLALRCPMCGIIREVGLPEVVELADDLLHFTALDKPR